MPMTRRSTFLAAAAFTASLAVGGIGGYLALLVLELAKRRSS